MFGSLSLGAIDMLRSVDMSHSMRRNEINRNATNPNPIKIELRETKRTEMRPPFCLQFRACSVHIPLRSCIAERRNSRPQPPCRFRRSSGPQIVSISYWRSRYFPRFFLPPGWKNWPFSHTCCIIRWSTIFVNHGVSEVSFKSSQIGTHVKDGVPGKFVLACNLILCTQPFFFWGTFGNVFHFNELLLF